MKYAELKKLCEEYLVECGWEEKNVQTYTSETTLSKILRECAIAFFMSSHAEDAKTWILREQLEHLTKYNVLDLEDDEKDLSKIDDDNIPMGCGEEDNL